MTALSIVDLERIANEASALGLDPLTVRAEVAPITDHGPDWIIVGPVHLSQGVTGWHGTVAVPPVQFGSARMSGRR